MERGGKLQSNNHVIASLCSLTPPPVTAGRRAAAAGKKHPARRRRLIKTGEDYYMQVCTSLQTYNHASTPPLTFLQVGCPSCRPTNSIKALKARPTKDSKTRCDNLDISNQVPTTKLFEQECFLVILVRPITLHPLPRYLVKH